MFPSYLQATCLASQCVPAVQALAHVWVCVVHLPCHLLQAEEEGSPGALDMMVRSLS